MLKLKAKMISINKKAGKRGESKGEFVAIPGERGSFGHGFNSRKLHLIFK